MLNRRSASLFIVFFVLLLLSAAVVNVAAAYFYDAYDRLATGNSWDFSVVPIPADFFGPGSDPFTEVVLLQGQPLGSTPDCPTGLGNADTIVKRLQEPLFPTIPSTDVIDIELVELDLVGISPITVTYNGGGSPELWNVEVTLSQLQPSTGTMTITKTHQNGGVFNAEINIKPRFTFTRISDTQTSVLDDGSQTDVITTTQSFPWVVVAPGYACPGCSPHFVPGNDGTQEVQITYTGARSAQAMTSSCEFTGGIPAMTEWGLITLLAVLFMMGALLIVRRRKAVRAVT